MDNKLGIPEFLLRWMLPMNLTDEQLSEIAARYDMSAASLKRMLQDARYYHNRRQQQ